MPVVMAYGMEGHLITFMVVLRMKVFLLEMVLITNKSMSTQVMRASPFHTGLHMTMLGR
jgi:hypothetical protein